MTTIMGDPLSPTSILSGAMRRRATVAFSISGERPLQTRESKPLEPQLLDAVQSLRCNDPSSLEILVERYGPGLHRYLLNRIKNATTAEDLFQEVWHQVLTSHQRLRNPERFASWLYGIARNVVSSSKRKGWREVSMDVLHPHADDPDLDSTEINISDPSAPDPRGNAHATSAREKIDTLMLELSDSAREMITLRFFDSFTTSQISEILNVPIGTVCSTVHRGLIRLREILQREGLTLEDLQ